MATKAKKKSRQQRLADTVPRLPGGLPRDTGPSERWSHGDGFVEERTDIPGITRRRVTTQTPLDRYLARGQITQEQFDAGDWLRQRFEVAQLVPDAKALDPAKIRVDCGRRPMEMTRGQSEAHGDVLQALRDVGPELSPVLVRVCGMGQPAGRWAEEEGYSGKTASTAGVVSLRHALDVLRRNYRP